MQGDPITAAAKQAVREALAAERDAAVYGQDGPVTVYEVKRTEVSLIDAAEWIGRPPALPYEP